MSAYNLAPVANWFSNFGSNTAGSNPNLPLSGGKLWTYAAGTTTPVPVYTTNAGVAWSNPIILGTDGRVPGAIWLAAGNAYKFVLQDSAGNPIPNGTLDNIVGVNDTSSSGAVSEWVVTGFVPTFSSATTFTTPGNTTGTFQVGRRVQATVTAGTVYGTVTSSTFGVSTTVVLAMDSGQALDGGLSAVNVGFLGSTHLSIPQLVPYSVSSLTSTGPISAAGLFSNSGQPSFTAHRSGAQITGTTVIFDTVDTQQGGTNYANGTGAFTAPNTGWYLFTVWAIILNNANGLTVTALSLVNTTASKTLDTDNYPPGLSNTQSAAMTLTSFCHLTAGDVVNVQSVTAFNANYDIPASNNAIFSGAQLF